MHRNCYLSGAPEFVPSFLWVHDVLICGWFYSSIFVISTWKRCLVRLYSDVQHDFFYIKWCYSCRLTVIFRMILVVQELPTFPSHRSSPPVFSVIVVLCSVLWAVVCPFSLFCCIVYPPMYDFWLTLWYLMTFLTNNSMYTLQVKNNLCIEEYRLI